MGQSLKAARSLGAVPPEARSEKAAIARLLVGLEANEIVKVGIERSCPVVAFHHPNQEWQVIGSEGRAFGEIRTVVPVGPENHRQGLQQLAVEIDFRPPD